MITTIKAQRVYDDVKMDPNTDFILVDRIWPRGITKERLKGVMWIKDLAPSNELRKWFSHDASKWNEFKDRYYLEIGNTQSFMDIIATAKQKNIVLLYASKERNFNNAMALKEFIERNL
ncbi:MAG: DUF488 family protein [Thermoplasmataceae archaeon]